MNFVKPFPASAASRSRKQMTHSAFPLTPESLLEHREWLRAIARGLVADENLVDDLEQRSWMKVLRRDEPVGSPRAWLRRVVKSAAVDEHRSTSRRRAREAAVARPEALPATDHLVMQAEAQRVVAQAVTALPEPYRTTVLLRYFEGLSRDEVATRMGAPVRTVQTRLRRAHVLLRDALDREFGDRRAWCLLLLPLGRTRSPAPLGTATAGAILMATKAKVVAGLLGVALLLVGVGVCVSNSETPPAIATRAAATAEAPRPAPPVVRRAVPKQEEPATPIPSAATRGRVAVVDPDGKPVAGALVEFLRLGGAGIAAAPESPRPLGTTDASGRAPWPEHDPPFPGILRASHAGFAPGERSVTAREPEVTVQLGRGFSISGVVVTEDGSPVAGATVEACVSPASHVLGNIIGVVGTWTVGATTQPDGAFRIEGVRPSSMGVVSARAKGYLETTRQWPDRTGRPLRIVLQRTFAATVRLRDRDGRALEGGAVWAFQGPKLRMDPDLPRAVVVPFHPAGGGLYEVDDLPAGWYSLLAAHAGHRTVVVDAAALRRDAPPIEIVLDETPGISGRVVDSTTHAPVVGAFVRCVPLCRIDQQEGRYVGPAGEMGGALVATSGEDGSFTIAVAGPGDDFVTEIRAEGYQQFVFTWKAAKAEWLREIALLPLVAVDYCGRIVSTDGAPIPGAIVRGERDSAAAGADGRFRLVARTGSDWITVLAPGFVSRIVAAPGHDISGGGLGTRDFGDVELEPTREIRGHVVDGDGAPIVAVEVWAVPIGPGGVPQGSMFGGAFGVSDDAGAVTLAVVPGVAYRVSVFGDTRPGQVVVEGDATDEFQLVVGADPRADHAVVRGRLQLDAGPWIPTRAWLTVDRQDGRQMKWAQSPTPVDPDGAFEIASVAPGTVRLRVFVGDVAGELAGVLVPPRGAIDVVVPCRRTVKSVDGEDQVAQLRLRIAEADATPGLVAWATRAPAARSVLFERAAGGAFSLSMKTGAACGVWVFDATAMRAGVAFDAAPGAAEPAAVALVAAGRVMLPPVSFEHQGQWVEIRDASERVVWSGPETKLPAIPGEGYFAVLPPGNWRFDVSDGIERKDPKIWRGVAVAGSTTRAEQ